MSRGETSAFYEPVRKVRANSYNLYLAPGPARLRLDVALKPRNNIHTSLSGFGVKGLLHVIHPLCGPSCTLLTMTDRLVRRTTIDSKRSSHLDIVLLDAGRALHGGTQKIECTAEVKTCYQIWDKPGPLPQPQSSWCPAMMGSTMTEQFLTYP